MKTYLSLILISGYFLCVYEACNPVTVSSENAQAPKEKKEWTLKDFYADDVALQTFTDSIYESLDTNQRAAQMIMTATGENAIGFSEVEKLYRDRIIGGILFFKRQ